ncbi:hypothetical protein [Butyrivibrio sp. JL13D10]|uniref:hypothetical protein n=1 Tax=Butyrivibrio sp. JL13D10 TaxID=3236815 RepID=UPI0038B665CD
MEERKKFAREIRKMFGQKMRPFLIGDGVLIVLALAVSRIPIMALMIALLVVIGIIYFILLSIADRYHYAGKIMYCRALLGKDITEDPVGEGLYRLRKIGFKNLRRYRRECGRIFYTVVKGAMSVGDMMENVPGLDKFAGAYKKLIKRLYENCAKTLVTYQIGCYEEANQDQFYDLVAYFIQDGKNFLLKTVKSEAKDFIASEISAILIAVTLLGYAFTKNILFAAVALVIFVLSVVLSANDDDFNILCDYIEYVQSHALNMELRDKLIVAVKTGNSVLDFTKAYRNPTQNNMRRAIKGAEEMIGSVENRI